MHNEPFKGLFLIIDFKKVPTTKEKHMQLSNRELLGIYVLF